ncbi:MAG: hypothetical protein HY721_11980 [Planctomycetes bacterium]|nr:hypothetical protein [Planctomycetota bacterium]
MTDLHLSFTGGWSPLEMAALAVAGAALLALLYRGTVRLVGTRAGTILLALKVAAFLLLLCGLFHPTIELREGRTATCEVVVLVDDSRSMEVRDSLDGAERLAAAKDVLLKGGLLEKLEGFDVRVHSLSGGDLRLGPDEVRGLEARLELSDLDQALAAVLRASGDSRRVAGAVLLTDGADNRDLPLSECEPGVPVYAVGLGSDAPPETAPRDLAIASVSAGEIARTESVHLVTVEVRGDGARRLEEPEVGKVEVRSGEALVASADFPVPQRGETVEATLAFAPRTAGFHRYTVSIPRLDVETTWENNRRSFSTQVLAEKIQVLYLEGVLRPEYKFLRLALTKDPGLELTSMVLTDAGRLYQQGGDAMQGFPASLQGMRRYDLVILGDVPPSFFTAGQLEDLKAYVAEEGGGLLMTGGTSSFGNGLWAGTTLEALLPFTVGGAGLGQVRMPLAMCLTQVGSRHPVFEGCREHFEPGGGASLPLLEGASRIERLKPGATLLAYGVGAAESGVPLLAVQRYGEGRCAGFTADTTWRWYLSLKGLGAESPYNRFWGQLARWLARPEKRTPDRERPLLVLASRRNYARGERAEVVVRALALDGEPPPSVSVKLVRDGEDPGAPAAAFECLAQGGEAAPGTPPLYRGSFAAPAGPGAEGHYRLVAALKRGAGPPDEAEAPVAVGGEPVELTDARLDRRGLAELCERTGGACYSAVQAPRLAGDLRRRVLEESRVRVVKVWDHALFFPLFLALVTWEWAWRKRRMLVALLIGPALWAWAPPPAAAAADEAQGLAGSVTLSDGTTLRGRIYARGDKPLEVHDVERNERRAVALREIERVHCEIERAEMLQAWRFAEEGSPEKVRWGKPYPRHDYLASVHVAGSGRIAGRLTGTIFVDGGGGPRRKLVLRAFQEGEKGQSSADLVFVKEIVIEGGTQGAARSASLAVRGARPKAARAFVPGRPERLEGRVEGEGASWERLAPARYSFAVELEGRVLVGWRDAAPDELGEKARSAAEELVKSSPDFFDDRRVLGRAAGRDGLVHVLVDQRRRSETTSYGGEEVFRQVAVWSMYPTDRRWVVDCRAIVFRERLGKGASPTPVVLRADLAGHEPGEGKPLEITVAAEGTSSTEAKKE